jgi:hypothetical protein
VPLLADVGRQIMRADDCSPLCHKIWSMRQGRYCYWETNPCGRFDALKPPLPYRVDHVAGHIVPVMYDNWPSCILYGIAEEPHRGNRYCGCIRKMWIAKIR